MREIFYAVKDWLIHLFDVHCSECRHESLENKQCDSCEYLKIQLETERHEKQKLLDFILALSAPQPLVNEELSEEQPLRTTKYEPWHVRRARLEATDRQNLINAKREASMRNDSKKSTEQLEKEILVGEN